MKVDFAIGETLMTQKLEFVVSAIPISLHYIHIILSRCQQIYTMEWMINPAMVVAKLFYHCFEETEDFYSVLPKSKKAILKVLKNILISF